MFGIYVNGRMLYNAILLPILKKSEFPDYQITKLPNYQITKLPNYQITKLPINLKIYNISLFIINLIINDGNLRYIRSSK